jgi:uncharacterized protein YegP (UPF0339 family)
MKIKYVLSFIFFFGIVASSIAQDSKKLLCKILDQESKYPVSYATIKFEDIQNGVIADEEGEFRLPLEYKTSNKTIIISSIGFESLRVSINTLNDNTINIIYLRPKIEALDAVMLSGKTKTKILSAEDIIKKAIKNIPVNYPQLPHSYISYYRDYQLVNDNYYNLNESILENFDAGFQTNKYGNRENVTALYSYDLNKNYYLDSMLLKSVYGSSKIINKDESAKFNTAVQNELEILNGHNPIRNYNVASFSFINTFRINFIDNHVFKLQEIKYMDETPLFEISFVSKDTENAKFKSIGKIYIAKTNYAIYKIEYKMLENEKFAQNRYKRGNSTKFESRDRLNTLFETKVEYKAVNDKMYLNYMTFNNRFIIKEPNPFKVEDFEFDPKDEAFYITFNKSVDKSSIERSSRFKLLYKNKKLIIKTIELVKTNVIKINVIDWAAGSKAKLTEVASEDFSYKLKRIKDTAGGTLDKESKILGYQFREFFTQEVFENKTPSTELIFIYKTRPLSASRVNEANFDINKYWVNSPLKQTKGDGF